ncbi:zinc ABC transporter substrate-binding protein [Bacillus sp. B15-48]|uniref:metal ABC transporter solute-binding protein, Zn/Mn family n=1 Tax=Bacillus sp. B15-48 TaxID=1548601 RepID=UPI00193F0DBA|nr:zinc ABC transporter substrate-binding protein [Bacillus sp. B15-48]MBM4761871.1 adhesin [Bacillus sp. B15-48]
MNTIKWIATTFLVASLLLAGCGNSESSENEENNHDEDRLTIYTTVYPLEDFTKKIGGEYVDVKSVYPPNVDAHSFEPSTKDMIAIAESDLFIYTGIGFEGFVEKASEALKNEDVTILPVGQGIDLIHLADEHTEENDDHEDKHVENAESHDHAEDEAEHDHSHGDEDPHIWLDPLLSIELAENIKNKLSELLPQHANEIEQNFIQLENDLHELDEEFKRTIEQTLTKHLLVAHSAYGYWEKRYGIKQIAIAGLSPTQEPSQKALQTIIDESKEHEIQYIIFEQNLTTKIAEIIQKEIGAKPLTLHNLETITDENIKNGDDYFSIMRKNLQTIQTALNN